MHTRYLNKTSYAYCGLLRLKAQEKYSTYDNKIWVKRISARNLVDVNSLTEVNTTAAKKTI